MANSIYKGVQYANSIASPQELIDEGLYDNLTYKIVDTFVLTADLASGDTILMGGYIPAGSILLDCKITNQALGGSCTINVGWQSSVDPFGNVIEAANATGFFSALPVSSASVATAHGSTYEGMTSSLSNFYLHQVQGAVQPVIAENAVSSGATGLQISIEISYQKG